MTNVEMNYLLGRLAYFLKQDNDFVQMLMKETAKSRKTVNDLTSIVVYLATEIKKSKGLEKRLDNVLERLISVEKQSGKHEDIYVKINKHIKKVREKKRKSQKTRGKRSSDTSYIG